VPLRSPSPVTLWDLDQITGEVSPPGASAHKCMLLDFGTLFHFVKNVRVSRQRGFFTQLFKSSWISPKYLMKWKATKLGAGMCKADAWLLTFRTDTR